jgi:hypothetical protein
MSRISRRRFQVYIPGVEAASGCAEKHAETGEIPVEIRWIPRINVNFEALAE